MEEYGYYNGIAYDARFPAKRIAALVPDGVYDQELQVVKWSGMTIRVNPGRAWQAGRFYYRDEVKELSAPAAHASLARVDAVVLRWDDLACKTEIVYVAGTPSSNPQAPALVRNETTYDFRLAEIRVPAGAGEITASMIHDTRYDAALCGVTAGFKKPDIEALMAEYTDQFLAWFGEKQQEIDDTLAVLNNANPIITVHAQKQGEGVYTATEERVKTYVPDMIWALYLDEPASGGVTVNVNNLGALAIKKVTEDGGLADPAELLPNVCNMAQYDGIQLRLLASPDASGWHRHTYTYAAKVGDTEVPIESPGGVYADDLLVLMTAGLVMQEGVDYTRGPDGSNSVSLSAPRTAAGDIYIEHFQQVSHAALGAIDGHMDSTSNPHQVTAEQVGAVPGSATIELTDTAKSYDLNDYWTPGQVVYIRQNVIDAKKVANCPSGTSGIMSVTGTSVVLVQTYVDVAGGAVYTRHKALSTGNTSGWGWASGIVSETTSNGSYIKWPDGTMECWGQVSGTSDSSGYLTVTFPVAFATTPAAFLVSGVSGAGIVERGSLTATQGKVGFRSYVNGDFLVNQASRAAAWHAIGRWK